MPFILPGKQQKLVAEVQPLLREEFSRVTKNNEFRSGTGAIFIPALTSVTAKRIGELFTMNFGPKDVGEFVPFDFGFDPGEKTFSPDHHVAEQAKKNTDTARTKALLGFMYGTRIPSEIG